MKLSKLLWKFRLAYLKWQQRRISNERVDPLALYAKLVLLEPKWLVDLSPSRTLGLSGNLTLDSLRSYAACLDDLTQQVRKGDFINRDRLKTERTFHEIQSFLKLHRGYYTDPVEDTVEFKQSALKLLQIYPMEPADHGINCHYQLMLRQTLEDVNQLVNLLLEVSRR